MRHLAFLFTLIVLLIIGTSAHAAWRGYSTADVNLRDGPGPGYGVVDVVPEGGRVFVDHCRRGWCAVDYRGEGGWMSRGFLEPGRIRESRHLRENSPPEYDWRDRRGPVYDDEGYREVIIIDPPRFRDGRHQGGQDWNRRVSEGRRIRNRNRNRIVRGDRSRGPDAHKGRRRNGNGAPRIRQRGVVIDETYCPRSQYCGGGIGPDQANRR